MKLISTYIRIAIKVDQIGTSCTNVYDLAGRMIEKQYHTGATPALGGVVTAGASLESTDTFTFDAASRVIATRKGRYNIRTQHSYALDSQPLTETIIANREVYTSSRTYDAANRPISHTFPNGKTTQWSYTARNLVSTVRYENELIATNTYDAGFRQTNQNYGNGLNRVITYARQDNLRSTDRVLTKDDLNFSYTYAVDKQVTAESIVADQVEDTSFTASYDAGNRLTAWNRAGSDENHSQTWDYDDAGNWNSTTKDGDTESRDHSVSDQITQLDGNPVSHDLKGNLTKYKYGRKNYKVKYDLDNRIFSVKSNRRKVTYRYDALGRRIISKKNGNRTALIWWGDSECAEYKHKNRQRVVQHDIMGHPTRLNSVIARDTARGKRKVKLQWYHKNYLDHVYAVSDDNGNLIEHYRYNAFGEPEIYSATGARRNTSAIGNIVMWNTRRYDADNGLYYYKYRHYATNIGRWLGRDPIEEDGGINLYGFVGNAPLMYWDKYGLDSGSSLTFMKLVTLWELDIDGRGTGSAWDAISNNDDMLYQVSLRQTITCDSKGNISVGPLGSNTTKTEGEDDADEVSIAASSVMMGSANPDPQSMTVKYTIVGVFDYTDWGKGLPATGAGALGGAGTGLSVGSAFPVIGNTAGVIGGTILGGALGAASVDWSKSGAVAYERTNFYYCTCTIEAGKGKWIAKQKMLSETYGDSDNGTLELKWE